MRIAEVFHSIQGEGRLVGVPSLFVRTSGCNLRCWFCDTPYTSWQPEGEQRTVDCLVEEIVEYGCEHVVLTGGEPMLNAELVPLTQRLAAAGHHITIETAGTLDLPVHSDLMSISPKLSNSTPTAGVAGAGVTSGAKPRSVGDLLQVHSLTTTDSLIPRSPGLPAGTAPATPIDWAKRHDERRHRPAVIRRLTTEYDFQLKFVVDTPDDVPEIETYLAEFPSVTPEHIYLMPQATDADTLRTKSRWLAETVKEHGWRLSPRLHVELWGNQRGV